MSNCARLLGQPSYNITFIIQGDPKKMQPKQKFLAEEWKEIKNCDKLQSKASLLEHMLLKFRANRFFNTELSENT